MERPRVLVVKLLVGWPVPPPTAVGDPLVTAIDMMRSNPTAPDIINKTKSDRGLDFGIAIHTGGRRTSEAIWRIRRRCTRMPAGDAGKNAPVAGRV